MNFSKEIEECNKSFICKRCGDCCGPSYISSKEQENIGEYLKEHGIEKRQHKSLMDKCPYFENNLCIIYPVRPLLCRLMGITDLMPCPKGNRPDKKIPLDIALRAIEENF
jgi:Fe-S-cluster containining protein